MFTLKGFVRVFQHPLNEQKFLQTLGRVLWWKWNQHMFQLPVLVEILDGVKILCYPKNSFSGLVVYTMLPEYEEIIILNKYIKKGDVCFDVGAHMGEYSLVTASKKAMTYAFEPTPYSRKLLEENVRLNEHFDKYIQVFPMVVSNINGYLQFTLTSESEVSHITVDKETHEKTIRIASITLDSFSKDHKISKIHFVKIDVEGAELQVMQGMKHLLFKHKVEMIMFEVGSAILAYGHTFDELRTYLGKFGYNVYFMTKDFTLRRIPKNWRPEKTMNIIASYRTPSSLLKK